MKITFLMPNWLGNLAGGVQSNIDLALHLQKRGHEVLLLCAQRKPILLKKQLKSLLKGNGLIKRSDFSYLDGLDIPAKIIPHEKPLTDKDVPDGDIVVATWWETAEWVAKLSPQKGAKVYMIRHHEVHAYLPQERTRATYKLPLHKVTISKWLVDLMRTEYEDKNVSLVYNSVDFEKFFASPRGKQTTPTVGMMYSPTYWKGCDISLKALDLVSQKIPNLRLIAFGKCKLSKGLTLPAKSKYYLQPPQREIKDIYAQCDVWLCGSKSEGFHRPPLEAMSCRCPVVSTRVGGPLDIIENGVNGYVVPVDDYMALADCLVKVLTLPDKDWQLMSDAAYETATSYTWDDAAQLFEKALYRAIERTKKGEL